MSDIDNEILGGRRLLQAPASLRKPPSPDPNLGIARATRREFASAKWQMLCHVFYRQLLKGGTRSLRPWCPTLVVVRNVVDLGICAPLNRKNRTHIADAHRPVVKRPAKERLVRLPTARLWSPDRQVRYRARVGGRNTRYYHAAWSQQGLPSFVVSGPFPWL